MVRDGNKYWSNGKLLNCTHLITSKFSKPRIRDYPTQIPQLGILLEEFVRRDYSISVMINRIDRDFLICLRCCSKLIVLLALLLLCLAGI